MEVSLPADTNRGIIQGCRRKFESVAANETLKADSLQDRWNDPSGRRTAAAVGLTLARMGGEPWGVSLP